MGSSVPLTQFPIMLPFYRTSVHFSHLLESIEFNDGMQLLRLGLEYCSFELNFHAVKSPGNHLRDPLREEPRPPADKSQPRSHQLPTMRVRLFWPFRPPQHPSQHPYGVSECRTTTWSIHRIVRNNKLSLL